MPEITFPSDFLWGAATSAHQVEGDNRLCDWWAWEQAGRVKERSGLACDHYRRFREDFDLAVQLGHRAHRFSIEWARIEPEEGRFDEAVLAHYRDVLEALHQRHLEPIVTLHHFTSPQWLAAQRSWMNPKVIDYFARYTQRVVEALGDQVRYWITINEPMVYVHMHYIEGSGPPGPQPFKHALRVIEHMIRAHAESYRVIHAGPGGAQARVSVAACYPLFVPCRRWWPLDYMSSLLTNRMFNAAFLETLTQGRWFVPGMGMWRIPQARQTLDYVGVNYYTRYFVRCGLTASTWMGQTCELTRHPHPVKEYSDMGWDIYPAAFTTVLRRVGRLGLPIIVTENGTWVEDDARRWQFIAVHLAAMAEAMAHGAKVIGYQYWSLLDNFEWARGFGPRFGLVEVDYKTQARRIRQSGLRYAQVCRTNRLNDVAAPG